MGQTKNVSPLHYLPRDYDVFVGVDVDKKKFLVTMMDHANNRKSLPLPYSAEHLLRAVGSRFPGQRAIFAYEAGPTGYGLHDELSAKGHRCLVVSPTAIPRPANERVKTNRLDSQKIAENLRGGQLRSIHVPSSPYRHLRYLVQLRDVAVKQVAAAKCRIKALLLLEGIAFPALAEQVQWSRAVESRIKELPCAPAVRFKLDQLLSALEFARGQVLETQREIRRFCAEDEELTRCIGYLRSVPGIGAITASHFLARVGDWRQLGNVRQMASFVGLVTWENSTGDRVRRGPITSAGDPRLRNKLVQAAWVAIRKDPEMREFYRRVYRANPREYAACKAVVAVARKMTMRLHVVLKEQRPYEIREAGSTPLAAEETIRPRERLDVTTESGELCPA
jgi:transposase